MRITNIIRLLLLAPGLALSGGCGENTRTVQPIRKPITETLFASGVLVPENQYNLTAQSDGYLISLNFEEGDIVEPGDLLAVIDNKTYDINAKSAEMLLKMAQADTASEAPAMKQVEANVRAAEIRMEQDQQQAERYQRLFESNSVSRVEMENMALAYEQSKANYLVMKETYRLQKKLAEQQLINQQNQSGVNQVLLGNNELRAVIGGKVYSRLKELGDNVRRGDVIAVIGHPMHLYSKLSVDESVMAKVRLDQKVVVQLNTHKNDKLDAIITEIYPAFDKQTQSFYCRADFTQPLPFLLSGTQLQANIIVAKHENALVIPRNFLHYGNKVHIQGEGLTKIETGIISTDWVEVLGGIDEQTTLISASTH